MAAKEKATGPTIETRLTYAGISAAARRFGCSREHLSRVLHGKRRANARIARGLARMGIDCGDAAPGRAARQDEGRAVK